MKHQLMTGTQGASIMLLPWELQLRSHICLCIHRLPLVFFPFPRHCSLPWCHASSWERTPLLSMLDYMRLRRWEGRGETSRSALYFKVDQTHAENSAPLSEQKMRDFLPLQAGICESEGAHSLINVKSTGVTGTWSAPDLAFLADRAQPLMVTVKHTRVQNMSKL